MEITGAIFDFDGTLFDSMPVWHGIRERFFARLGITMTMDDHSFFKGLYSSQALPLAIERFGLKMTYEEILSSFFDYIKELYLANSLPKNDIIEFLKRLKAKGVKIGIATASGEPAVIAALEKFGMLDYFPIIYSTYTVDVPKTESKVYDVVLAELGTDKETTWVFEDALYAAKTAKASGYKLVGIYDESEKNQEELKEIADIYIHNYAEIEL
jgi:HAD superfamily hydrolase (TIGR01509 family)